MLYAAQAAFFVFVRRVTRGGKGPILQSRIIPVRTAL